MKRNERAARTFLIFLINFDQILRASFGISCSCSRYNDIPTRPIFIVLQYESLDRELFDSLLNDETFAIMIVDFCIALSEIGNNSIVNR